MEGLKKEPHPIPIDIRYMKLKEVLNGAYEQATVGKGHVRHDDGKPIENQHTLDIGRRHRGHGGFLTGQAEKKIEEARNLEPEQAIKELLGAIVYCAFEIIILNEKEGLCK